MRITFRRTTLTTRSFLAVLLLAACIGALWAPGQSGASDFNTVVATVGVGTAPMNAAVSPDLQRVYVTNSQDDTVSVIDTDSNQVIGSPIAVGDGPYAAAVSPDGQVLYVTNTTDATVSVVDLASGTVVHTIAVDYWPTSVVFNAAGTKAYTVNQYGDSVSVIDVATSTVEHFAVMVGAHPTTAAINPAGTKLYVTNSNDNTVSVIDTASATVDATIGVGSYPFGISVSPDGTRAYASNFLGGSLSVINTSTNAVDGTISLGSRPKGVTVHPMGGYAYVTLQTTLGVVDLTQGSLLTTVAVGAGPSSVAINKSGYLGYVVNQTSANVSVVDVLPNPIISSVSPNHGDLAGGTSITISGSFLSTMTSVDVGGVSCPITSQPGASQIVCTTGAHGAGAVDVQVSSTQRSATASGAFTYEVPPTTTTTSTTTTSTTTTIPATTTTFNGDAPITPSDGKPLELPPGQGAMIGEDGSITPLNVEQTGPRSISVGITTIGMELSGDGVEGSTLALSAGGEATTSGYGFAPGTEVTLFSFSTPQKLGVTTVLGDGTFRTVVPIPTDLSVGDHTIQAQGTGSDGGRRALLAGVRVGGLAATGSFLTTPLTIAGGVLFLLGMVVLSRRFRRGISLSERTSE